MPPPPPPSASYSLVIHDSSSEEEDDDDDLNDNYYNRKQSIIRPKAKLVVPPVKSNTTATLSKDRVIALPSSDSHHLENQNQRLRKQLEDIGALPQTSSSSTMNVALQDPDNEIKCGDGSEDEEEDEESQKVVISNDIMHSPPTKKKKSKRNKKNKGKKKMKKRIILDALDEEESTKNEKEKGSKEYYKLVVAKAEESVVVNVGDNISIASDGCTHHSTGADDGLMMTSVEDAGAVDAVADALKSPTTCTKGTFLNNVMEERKECNDTKLLQPTKARSTKSVSFSTVSVREYARMIGTHVVPADGGWPLGLSDVVVTEYNKSDNNIVEKTEVSSPPAIARIRTNNGRVNDDDDDDDIEKLMSWIGNDDEYSQQGHHRIRARSESLASLPSSVVATSMSTCSVSSSPSAVTTHSRRISWTVDDFESRRQTELRQRYAQLIRDRRRKKFEVEWERKHLNVFHNKQHHTRKSVNGGGSRTRSSSFKMEMTLNEKEELDALVNMNIMFPSELESRPYDYKKRVCPSLIKSKGKGGCAVTGNDNVQGEDVKHAITEEDELYHEYGGRNPLFRTMREDERRKALHRDDHLMSTYQYCQVIDHGAASEDENFALLDPTNTVVTQRVQHDLETLRSRRSDLANLGCACRKLQIFLPKGSSSNKRKSSHRRLPERKVHEELRKRGLLHGADMSSSSSTVTREELEILLHDAIEKEPCCWGTNCPCWRDGIGCQSETCSCWHHGDSSSTTKVDEYLLKSRCGNPNGIYFVNFVAIKQYREQYLSCAPSREGS